MTTLIIICLLAALGLLTASNAVMEKLPSAGRVISAIRPFEEIIGIISFVVGGWFLFWGVLKIINVLNLFSIFYWFNIVSYLVLIGLGAYLARATLTKTLPFAANIIEKIVSFVTGKRRTIGITALVLSAVHLFFWLT
ncbi:hypothetical protein N9K16_02950 [Alphaproteobacteria bacterium]|nr:hypothetical protein [Alphaproteobacteria bacterium]